MRGAMEILDQFFKVQAIKEVSRQIFLKPYNLFQTIFLITLYLGLRVFGYPPPSLERNLTFNELFSLFLGSFFISVVIIAVNNMANFYAIFKSKPASIDILEDEDRFFIFPTVILTYLGIILPEVSHIEWLSTNQLWIISSMCIGIPIPNCLLRYLLQFNVIKRREKLCNIIRLLTTSITLFLIVTIFGVLASPFIFFPLVLLPKEVSFPLSYCIFMGLVSILPTVSPILLMRYGFLKIDISISGLPEDVELFREEILVKYPNLKYKRIPESPLRNFEYSVDISIRTFRILNNCVTCLELISDWFNECLNKNMAKAIIFMSFEPFNSEEEIRVGVKNIKDLIKKYKAVTKLQIIKLSIFGIKKI